MHLGRVVGTCIATQKDPSLQGVTLLLMQPLTEKLQNSGPVICVADPMGARPGDIVAWVASREASLALLNKFAPVDAAIVGLVDRVGDQNVEGGHP